MRAKLREVAEAKNYDPVQSLLDALDGGHEGIEVCRGYVLAAAYIPPPRTTRKADGTDFTWAETDRQLAEHRFQGRAFLVLKVGPLAFKDDGRLQFGNIDIKPMDWIMARPSDGVECFVADRTRKAGVSCKLFNDVEIQAKLSDPSLIY